jgi:PTH1 family peptidyl-tRNA hydrolase
MNLSGNAVIKAASFYKILPEQIIVIHDDMDLQPGQMKAKLGGGAGGHNGLKSIDSHIGANYNRIRLGVGHPQASGDAVVNHVLSRFSKTDAELLARNIEIVVKDIPVLLKKGVGNFSNQIALDNKKASN